VSGSSHCLLAFHATVEANGDAREILGMLVSARLAQPGGISSMVECSHFLVDIQLALVINMSDSSYLSAYVRSTVNGAKTANESQEASQSGKITHHRQRTG
jgi:hypothetical protein